MINKSEKDEVLDKYSPDKFAKGQFSPRVVYLKTKICDDKELNPIAIYMKENNISIAKSFGRTGGKNSKYPPELTYPKVLKLCSADGDTPVDINTLRIFCKYYKLDLNEIINHVKTYVRYIFDDNSE